MEYIVATGRRKASVARIYLKKGSGKITINDKDWNEYVDALHLKDVIVEPLVAIDARNDFDIKINVHGGGIKGQAEAIRLGISRALIEHNEEIKPELKKHDLLTRDPRRVERK
ncbi:MAG: 30S ribosomal protein S9, partial [Phototrophicales bacterium]